LIINFIAHYPPPFPAQQTPNDVLHVVPVDSTPVKPNTAVATPAAAASPAAAPSAPASAPAAATAVPTTEDIAVKTAIDEGSKLQAEIEKELANA